MKGHVAWNKGKKMPNSMVEKMRKYQTEHPIRYWLGKQRPRGENNPKWKGGYKNKLWHNKQRKIKIISNGGFHSLGEWETLKAQYNWTCPSCKLQEPIIKLNEDHIIPLSLGGSSNIENIQPLCGRCNSIKHNKIIKY